MNDEHRFTEHRIPRDAGTVYARDYPGNGPAFVAMHGFPDHLGIYDDLVPLLVAAGRRVVTFDFLGFGRSDKLPGATYGFAQQLGDLGAVIDALALDAVVPVAHDSAGPTAINYCLANPDRVASLCILNSAYDDATPVVWPELVTMFASPTLAALAGAIARDPAQFGWLLTWQQAQFVAALPDEMKPHFAASIGPLIADNFTKAPGSGPAFMQLAAQFFAELARNRVRLPELKALDVPVKVIWGEFDHYLTTDMAKDRAARFKHASLRILPAGHWLQSDLPQRVAAEMLS